MNYYFFKYNFNCINLRRDEIVCGCRRVENIWDEILYIVDFCNWLYKVDLIRVMFVVVKEIDVVFVFFVVMKKKFKNIYFMDFL